jgi:hypothetical protein
MQLVRSKPTVILRFLAAFVQFSGCPSVPQITLFTRIHPRLLRSLRLSVVAALVSLSAFAEETTPSGPQEKVALKLDVKEDLMTEVQQRAFRFFVDKSDSNTGLTQDRARNDGSGESQIASIASTGYALAALPIGVEHGWIERAAARGQALRTLRFLRDQLPHEHGFYYHFVDKHSGARAWKSEVSSLDSALLFCGVIAAGQYFGDEAAQLANDIYDRADWMWMLTNGGDKPKELSVSHGWKPESGFLAYNYGAYCEAVVIYLLGMGSSSHPLPSSTWQRIENSRTGLIWRLIESHSATQRAYEAAGIVKTMESGSRPLQLR